MKTVNVATLSGPALDWAVYICWWNQDYQKYGDDYRKYKGAIGDGDSHWSPSEDWKYGLP